MSPVKDTQVPFGIWNHSVVVQPNNFIYKSLSNWAVNIAVGCGHACRFCYVPSSSTNKLKPQLQKLGVDDPDADWGDYVFLREWDEEAFRASVRRAEQVPLKSLAKDGNRAVIFCSTTDPYQVFRHPDPVERKKLEDSGRHIMRRSLEILRDESTLNVRILTRSPLARQDFDLFKTFEHRLLFGMSLPTLNNTVAKVYEPKAPAPSVRLATLKAAKEIGIPVYVAMAPTYPECDEADLRATLTAVRDLEPYTIFHEPINIRSENVERIAAHAKEIGVTLKTEVFANRESWKEYALDALTTVQRIAKELKIDRNLHLWPDRCLGAGWVIDSFDNKRRPAYKAWLKQSWNRVSEWPQPTVEYISQAKVLTDLIAQAKRGQSWTNRQIENVSYYDALELVQNGDYDTLPKWAKMVIQNVFFDYYLEVADLPDDRISISRKLPPLVEAMVARLTDKKPAPVPLSTETRKQLRLEAFAVWQQIKQSREPASHRLSKPLREKYGISKAALGAVYAHFTMGKAPKR